MLNYYQKLKVSTPKAFTVCDVTEDVGLLVRESDVLEGMITITSFHTTCALSVNENEERLFDDIRNFFLTLAPPGHHTSTMIYICALIFRPTNLKMRTLT